MPPAAVERAKELDVDAEEVEGTGAEGRITVRDLLKAAAEQRFNTRAHVELDSELEREMERIESEGDSQTERENLPEEPGVTYRDVKVRWKA